MLCTPRWGIALERACSKERVCVWEGGYGQPLGNAVCCSMEARAWPPASRLETRPAPWKCVCGRLLAANAPSAGRRCRSSPRMPPTASGEGNCFPQLPCLGHFLLTRCSPRTRCFPHLLCLRRSLSLSGTLLLRMCAQRLKRGCARCSQAALSSTPCARRSGR